MCLAQTSIILMCASLLVASQKITAAFAPFCHGEARRRREGTAGREGGEGWTTIVRKLWLKSLFHHSDLTLSIAMHRCDSLLVISQPREVYEMQPQKLNVIRMASKKPCNKKCCDNTMENTPLHLLAASLAQKQHRCPSRISTRDALARSDADVALGQRSCRANRLGSAKKISFAESAWPSKAWMPIVCNCSCNWQTFTC